MTYQRVPPVPSGYSNTYQIFQAPGQVVILNEMIHDARVVPLDGRPPIDGRIRQWNGDGRGPLGRRHARDRDDALPRRHDVAGVPGHPRPARGRAVHPHRRRHHRVPLHDSRRRRPTRAPSRWSCLSSAPPATSSTSTRVTRGTTRSPTCWAVSASWRPPRSGHRKSREFAPAPVRGTSARFRSFHAFRRASRQPPSLGRSDRPLQVRGQQGLSKSSRRYSAGDTRIDVMQSSQSPLHGPSMSSRSLMSAVMVRGTPE